MYKNKDLTYAALTNSFHSSIHKHWDNLSVIYGYKGQDILVDPGKFKYEKSDIRNLVISSECHNTVTIKGKQWNAKNLVSNSLDLKASESQGHIVSCQACMDLSFDAEYSFNRRLNVVENGIDVEDSSTSKETLTATYILHKESEVVEINSEKVFVLSVGSILVSLAFSDQFDRPVFPVLTKLPVSYEYGSFEYCLAFKVDFYKCLKAEVRVLDGAGL